jgi:putative copper resistance protein D
MMLAFGTFVFTLFIGAPALRHAGQGGQARLEQLERWTLRCTRWSAVAGVVSGLAWLALVAAQMSGTPIGQALSRAAFTTVLADTHFGQVSQFRLIDIVLLLVYAIVLLQARRNYAPWRHAGGAIVAASSLASIAWLGHAAATERAVRWLHLTCDAVHLLAAGGWLGALVALAWLSRSSARDHPKALRDVTAAAAARFSLLGIACVGGLVITGIGNAWFLMKSLSALLDTPYGRILLLKLALFAGMLGIAIVNRQILTPRLVRAARNGDEHAGSVLHRRLQRNISAETALGILVVLLVGALGITQPGAHMHHVSERPPPTTLSSWR